MKVYCIQPTLPAKHKTQICSQLSLIQTHAYTDFRTQSESMSAKSTEHGFIHADHFRPLSRRHLHIYVTDLKAHGQRLAGQECWSVIQAVRHVEQSAMLRCTMLSHGLIGKKESAGFSWNNMVILCSLGCRHWCCPVERQKGFTFQRGVFCCSLVDGLMLRIMPIITECP